MERVDIIERFHFKFTDNSEYSIVIGLSKSLNFYVYDLPNFYIFYKGTNETEAFNCYNKLIKNEVGYKENFV